MYAITTNIQGDISTCCLLIARMLRGVSVHAGILITASLTLSACICLTLACHTLDIATNQFHFHVAMLYRVGPSSNTRTSCSIGCSQPTSTDVKQKK